MAEQITFAANNGDLGGGEQMLLRCAEAARDLGRKVTVVGPSTPSEVIDTAARAGFDVTAIRASGRRDYLPRLRAWDRNERRGVLWCHGLVPSLASAGHRRRIVHLHQLPSGRGQRLALRLAMPRAIAIVAPSDSMAAALPGAVSLPNWTGPATPHPRDVSREGPPVVGFLGRRSTDKGLDLLADAVASPALAVRSTRLVVAGDDRYVPEESRRLVSVALTRLGPRADVLGHVDRDDFFAQVDLAAFPSVWPEPFGLVVIEAMAARVPFVISDAGALPEVAGPDYPWVSRAGDEADLARILDLALAAEPETVNVVTSAAHARWETEYSPEAGLRRVAALLERLEV